MPDALVDSADAANPIPLVPLSAAGLAAWRDNQPEAARAWLSVNQFTGRPGQVCLVPDENGRAAMALIGDPSQGQGDEPLFGYGGVALTLPPGDYQLVEPVDATVAGHAALGWALGTYSFDRYKTNGKKSNGRPEPARLVWPEGIDRDAVTRAARATAMCRDLINTPAEDLGPSQLAAAAETMAAEHDAKVEHVVGDALLDAQLAAIHTVGRASDDPPRLIDITWGNPDHPKVTLVGKGVCFDTGGLDIKPARGMEIMKKDMGGAANILGIADMLMGAGAPIRLRTLVPAVENNIAGNAFRPHDIIKTRAGITVEVGNTDAEGRLILCDALTVAVEEKPDLIVDMATLTGAARVALGTDLPALFCNDDGWANAILDAGTRAYDAMWRMPLYAPYAKGLEGHLADINNISDGPYGGAIVAALFLQRFVPNGTAWAHVDLMAWNLRPRPGHPRGGEAMGMRAIAAAIMERYADA